LHMMSFAGLLSLKLECNQPDKELNSQDAAMMYNFVRNHNYPNPWFIK
jgi:hypothetical protein